MADVTGEIETEEGVLVIRRIHVHYRLRTDDGNRAAVERVHAIHADHCPVARSVRDSIAITTEYELVGS